MDWQLLGAAEDRVQWHQPKPFIHLEKAWEKKEKNLEIQVEMLSNSLLNKIIPDKAYQPIGVIFIYGKAYYYLADRVIF